MLLANTYHLLLRPGPEVFEQLRRPAPLDGLARRDPDRLGRLPGLLARAAAASTEDGARFAATHDGTTLAAHARALDRDAARDRLRHHDGARSVHRLDQPARRGARRDGAHASLGARARSPRAATRRRRCSRSCRARASRTCAARAPASLTQHRRFDGYAIGGLAVGETRARARGHHRAHRRAAARGSAALPDGRRHAARPARGRASRRRHVRLHPADRVGAAGRRVHVARPDRPAPRRPPARRRSRSMPRATATTCARLLALVPAPPDQVRGAARLAAARDPQPALLPAA